MKKLVGIAGFAFALAAVTALPGMAAPPSSAPSKLALYQKYAEAPVPSITYFRTDRFQYLGPGKLAVWLHPTTGLYLLTLASPCSDLGFTGAIGMTSSNHVTYAGSDFIKFGSVENLGVHNCKIVKIVPVDLVKMRKADPAAWTAAVSQG